MPTSYRHFRNYFQGLFKKNKNYYPYVPESHLSKNGDEVVDEKEAAEYLYYLIDSECEIEWHNFEESLGEIDLLGCFDELFAVYDRDGDRNLWKEAYNVEDMAKNLRISIPNIKVFFSNWVCTIDLPRKRLKGFLKLIDPNNDLFITFNYTRTLEEVYQCKNVVHMHGESGEEIIFGHNGTTDYTEENRNVPIGCYNYLQEIYNLLRKDTEEVIKKHIEELMLAANCSNIYSFGFSYSSIDMPYIKKLCEILKGKNATWLLNDFDNKNDIYKRKIREAGFDGHFSEFSVDN